MSFDENDMQVSKVANIMHLMRGNANAKRASHFLARPVVVVCFATCVSGGVFLTDTEHHVATCWLLICVGIFLHTMYTTSLCVISICFVCGLAELKCQKI